MTEIEFMRQEIADLRKEVALLRAALGNRPQQYQPIPVIGPGLYPPIYPTGAPVFSPPWIVTCKSQEMS